MSRKSVSFDSSRYLWIVPIIVTAILILVCCVDDLAADIIHRYSFDSDASDSIGLADGGLQNGAFVVGGAVQLDGVDDHVSLPIGASIASHGSMTIEGWFILDSVQPSWTRLFDFGNSTSQYMFLTTRSANGSPSNTPRFAETISGNGNEARISSPGVFDVGQEVHFAVTIDGGLDVATLFIDGLAVATNNAFTLSPSDLGNTSNNFLGRSQFSADPYLDGSINEFRIYDNALSSVQVSASFLAGPNNLAVPEPGSMAIILLFSGSVLGRRRL